MAYPASGATIRGDLNAVVEQAAQADGYFVGLKVAPLFPVPVRSGSYPVIDYAGGQLLAAVAKERSRGSSYGEVVRKWTSGTYDCVDVGAEEAIDDIDARDLARYFDVEASVARWVRRNVQLELERQIGAAALDTNTWTNGNGAVAYSDANLATIDFPRDVLTAIEACRSKGSSPNTIVMNSIIYRRVRLASKTQTWVSGQVQRGAVVTATSIAQSFADEGIEQVLVGRAFYNDAQYPSVSMKPCWGYAGIWVGYVNLNARSLQDGGAMFTLVWAEEGGNFVTESYRDEARRSEIVRVRINRAVKVVDPTAGYIINTQVTS